MHVWHWQADMLYAWQGLAVSTPAGGRPWQKAAMQVASDWPTSSGQQSAGPFLESKLKQQAGPQSCKTSPKQSEKLCLMYFDMGIVM